MRFKISFKKFLEYSKNIEGKDEVFALTEMMRLFFPKRINVEKCAQIFKSELENTKTSLFFYKIGIPKKAGEFIDAHTFLQDENYLEVLKIILKPRFFYAPEPTLQQAQIALNKLREYIVEVRQNYPWIYTPPIFHFGNNEVTTGVIERQRFTEDYGAYMEIIYLLCKADLRLVDEITSWDLDRFLFQGEYLLRKRIVENLK